MLGKLLRSLESSGQADNTWILLWSDHGWHLGKEHWGKDDGIERHVPLIIVPPEIGAPEEFEPGTVCDELVNPIDLYPTLIDTSEIFQKTRNWMWQSPPLVVNPNADWSDHTVTTFGRGNHAITGKRWRYIQYFDGSAEPGDRSRDPLRVA